MDLSMNILQPEGQACPMQLGSRDSWDLEDDQTMISELKEKPDLFFYLQYLLMF